MRTAGRFFKGLGAGLRTIGRDLSNPGLSRKEEMIKKHGKWYSRFGKRATMLSSQASRMIPGNQLWNKIMRQRIENRDKRQGESALQKGVTIEEIVGLKGRFEKEVGAAGAKQALRHFGVDVEKNMDISRARKRYTKEQATERTKGIPGLSREQRLLISAILEGEDRQVEPLHMRGVVPEEVAEEADWVKKERGEKGMAEFEKRFGVEAAPPQPKKTAAPARRSSWRTRSWQNRKAA